MITQWTQSHQRYRWLLSGIGALVVLGLFPVFGSTIAQSPLSPLEGIDHIGAICLIALHSLLTPVHYLFQGMLIAGFLYAVWDRLSAWIKMRRVLQWLPAVVPNRDDVFGRAAIRAGLPVSAVRVVDGLANPAFTVGLWNPRIYIAAALPQHLTFDELTAVLRHEAVHVARRDPLRLSVLRFLACTLFWIPALRRLTEDVADEAELEADRQAGGEAPLVLASALVSLARWNPQATLHVEIAVGFTRDHILNRRVRSLIGEQVPARSRVSRGGLMSALATVMVAWTVGMVVSHPMPHSVTHTTYSFTENWECLSSRIAGTQHECPHKVVQHEMEHSGAHH